MGYITKDIAIITEPKIVSLVGSPNFVTFASKAAAKTYIDVDIKIVATPATPSVESRTVLRVYEASGALHEFHGTTDPSKVGGNVFLVASSAADTAENLREALLAVQWIDANFEVRIPSTWTGSEVISGDTLNIKGKGAGAEFRINILAPNNTANSAYAITWTSNTSTDGDTIKGNVAAVEIELDVYENPDTFLGADDRPIDEDKLGRRVLSLQKTYAGAPVWFDVNGAFSKYREYNAPPTSGWFDAGTAKKFRFIAKVKGINNYNFYISNTLFSLNGFARVSAPVNMSDYVYGDSSMLLLTTAPARDYVRGQKAFLNFIYSDPQRGQPAPVYPTLYVRYTLLTRGGNVLAQLDRHAVTGAALSVVNSLVLDIDYILDTYDNVGEVRIGLVQEGAAVSNEIIYNVRPECLHDVTQFVFINSLGGWDAVNFDAPVAENVARSADTYNKTITPQTVGGAENVYTVRVAETFTLEGAPVDDAVAEWLKEFAASPVIFDAAGRQIIIEEFTLAKSDASKNMHTPKLIYRINDTYTNE